MTGHLINWLYNTVKHFLYGPTFEQCWSNWSACSALISSRMTVRQTEIFHVKGKQFMFKEKSFCQRKWSPVNLIFSRLKGNYFLSKDMIYCQWDSFLSKDIVNETGFFQRKWLHVYLNNKGSIFMTKLKSSWNCNTFS